MKADDIRFYVDVLKGEQCACERPKARGFAFCRRCYFRLPEAMRAALYRPLRNGFEEAYEEACKELYQ